jgi:hypothetical protein
VDAADGEATPDPIGLRRNTIGWIRSVLRDP